MRKYLNTPMEALARQLTPGLLRLRKGYIDSAEDLLQIVQSGTDYPHDFVVYRVTGYRPDAHEVSAMLTGQTLRHDLQQLMLDLCDSFPLRASDYDQAVYGMAELSRRFKVSHKTVQRWCRRGLAARRMILADGRRHVAFLSGSVDRFIRDRRIEIARSMKFSQLTLPERLDIIRRARRMARFTQCTLSEVARRIAARTGRAVETIRYTIRRHDRQNPSQAVFPLFSRRIDAPEKQVIYQCFLSGVTAPALAGRYRRSRGSIYRIINEMRARQLLSRPIDCIYSPQFDLPDADEMIAAPPATAVGAPDDGKHGKYENDGNYESHTSHTSHTSHALVASPASVDSQAAAFEIADDASLYYQAASAVPLLTAAQERDLFRRYNYLKYKADQLRKTIDTNRPRMAVLRQVESLLVQANLVKNAIIRANLRLVISIARKHMRGPQTIQELISDGNVSILQAVEGFDYSRGFRFSTYASWAIMRSFARTVPKEKYQLDRFSTGHDEVLDIAAGLQKYDPNELNLPELRESLDALLGRLSPRERAVIVDHYGLEAEKDARTFDELGRRMGVSKERVRQIEKGAMKKLREIIGKTGT